MYDYRKGSSIRCCYNDYGNLLFSPSNPLTGSYLLRDAVDSNYQHFDLVGKQSQLSYMNSHVKNYFSCCSADLIENGTLTQACSTFSYKRSVATSCNEFRYSGLTAVVGDPHFVTADGTKYTFNGVGEYWLVYSDNSANAKIQVRFSKAVNYSKF